MWDTKHKQAVKRAEKRTYTCPLCKRKFKGVKSLIGSCITDQYFGYPLFMLSIKIIKCIECIKKDREINENDKSLKS